MSNINGVTRPPEDDEDDVQHLERCPSCGMPFASHRPSACLYCSDRAARLGLR